MFFSNETEPGSKDDVQFSTRLQWKAGWTPAVNWMPSSIQATELG